MARGIEVHNGKVVLGDIESLEISRVYPAGEVISGMVRGARIYLRDDESDPTVISGDIHALYILDMLHGTHGSSSLLRLEFNPLVSATRGCVLNVPISTLADIDYFIDVNPSAKTAWASAGDKTGGTASGWLRCMIGAAERYIQLYQPA